MSDDMDRQFQELIDLVWEETSEEDKQEMRNIGRYIEILRKGYQ